MPTSKVTDPHSSTEENYHKIPHPGGARPPKGLDIGTNDCAHDGKPKPKPQNVES